jgi:integrase
MLFEKGLQCRRRARLIRLHDVRHTMATLALQAGGHPKVVQEQLGHAAPPGATVGVLGPLP